MTEIRCPECNVELMEHLDSACLENWINEAVYKDIHRPVNLYACDIRSAWLLMGIVWEMNPGAIIHKRAVSLDVVNETGDGYILFESETIMLSICRAALWLAYQETQKRTKP